MANRMSKYYVQSRGVCDATGKKRFYFTDALRVARYERRRHHSNHHPYPCTSCGDFHVGSSEGSGKNLRSPLRRKK